MRNSLRHYPKFLRPKSYVLQIFLLFLLLTVLFPLYACQKEIDYFAYVAESRNNVFYAENNGFILRVYAVEKEYPYCADGIKRDTSARAEIRLFAPTGDKDCNVSFHVNGEEYGGDMSYDNVKAEYFFSCTLDISNLSQIDCNVVYGEEEMQFCAQSVKTKNTLSPREILEQLRRAETELFSSLSDKYGFAGEIYIRLLYEDFPYYYVSVIDRNGNTNAFLMNGETGEILAKRQG
ncbi:MAG: hypothetical protein E7355_04885 [Clostridiales bacterium]|nr:hypothetical protein [Clostridiales bacterium]